MEDAGNPSFVAAHARDIDRRTRDESDRLTRLLLHWCWPAGHDDRFDAVAVGWLSRWSPETLAGARPVCTCAEGRCAVCN